MATRNSRMKVDERIYLDTARSSARSMVLIVCDALENYLKQSPIESPEMAIARHRLRKAISAYRAGTHGVSDIGTILRACQAAAELGYLSGKE